MVYENCKIYGPYKSRKDNRLRIMAIFPDKTRRTVSYPKYVMEVYLDRYLDIDETIDHIDSNPLNNEISNLRIMSRKIHCANDAIRNKDVKVKCTYCGKEFIIPGKVLHYRNRADRHQSGYFCSKRCSSKYGREIQLKLREPEIIERVVPEKYKLRDES